MHDKAYNALSALGHAIKSMPSKDLADLMTYDQLRAVTREFILMNLTDIEKAKLRKDPYYPVTAIAVKAVIDNLNSAE